MPNKKNSKASKKPAGKAVERVTNYHLDTDAKCKRFFETIYECYGNNSMACRQLGIAVETPYKKAENEREDGTFEKQWRQALQKGKDRVKDIATCAKELVAEQVEYEKQKHPSVRDIAETEKVVNMAGKVSGEWGAGGGTSVTIHNETTIDNRQIRMIEPVFIRPDPRDFEVDTKKLREDMAAEAYGNALEDDTNRSDIEMARDDWHNQHDKRWGKKAVTGVQRDDELIESIKSDSDTIYPDSDDNTEKTEKGE